jgi:hypothetical protein
MRQALWRKYEQQVDPDETLDPDDRHRRAKAAMRADLLRRAYQSAKARAQRPDDALADALMGVAR